MNLEIKSCSNPICSQTFKVWEKDKKENHFCSESCAKSFKGENKSFWGSEDRIATALKNAKLKMASEGILQ